MTVYRLANLTYQWSGDDLLLRKIAAGADVLLLVEARDAGNRPVDVAGILGREWSVSQDRTSGATAGSVIAVRRRNVKLRWSLARLLSPAGRDVQDRYKRAAAIRPRKGKTARVMVFHSPLPKTGRQGDAIESALRWVDRQRKRGKRWLVACDGNMPYRALQSDLDAPHAYGEDVMAFCWGHGWGEVETSAERYDGTDHHVLTLTTKESR